LLADRLVSISDNNPISEANRRAGIALHKCFPDGKSDPVTGCICNEIESAVMIQRMLGKAKEIIDNKIIVVKYSADNGLVAHVSSMAVIKYIHSILGSKRNGYSIDQGVLSAVEFGAPQKRMRFVVMGVKIKEEKVELPKGTFDEDKFRTVHDAISDLKRVKVRTEMAEDVIGIKLPPTPDGISELGEMLRDSILLKNHISTATTPDAIERFKAIKQGQNFHDLPEHLKKSYSDSKRTQNTIYLRLKYNEPSGTVVNVRKSMWIHPVLHRAISIREAARLQTFPDSFVFCGTKDSQYQQVGNAVPPILARALAEHLCGYLDRKKG
jgi:DNA (cytosine-5)-methyltransferase 1